MILTIKCSSYDQRKNVNMGPVISYGDHAYPQLYHVSPHRVPDMLWLFRNEGLRVARLHEKMTSTVSVHHKHERLTASLLLTNQSSWHACTVVMHM